MNAIALPPLPRDDFLTSAPELKSFDHIPDGYDVLPMAGMVAVYWRRWRDIKEGSFYVVESQHPVGGMSWETYDQMNATHGPGAPRVPIKTTRRVIRVVRREGFDDHWWFVHESGFCDGPYKDWAVGSDFVGEVVGIYRPEVS